MVAKYLALIGAYFRINLAAALEYRTSLVSQVVGMFINDLLWVAFWVLYFTKFPVLRGWTLQDVIVLWAVVTTAFGIVVGLMANSIRIPQLVVQGQLDYFLALPKNVLLHMLVSQIRLVNFGDALFGPILLVVMVDLTPTKVLVFIVSTMLAAMVLLGFFILAGSLSFFLGNSDALSNQIATALIHFSTYPTTIFEQGVKFILFTLIPAGFVSTLPVELVREFDWLKFLQLAGGAVFFLGLAIIVFHRGLKRYESGNLMVMRS
ncbi:MAG: ABC transporter permease [Bacillota bacterium]